MEKQEIRRLMGDSDAWSGFLRAAARLYKYSFQEQVLIYAQRPDATACAPLETWNHAMNRFVKSGSKGIALLTGDGRKLRYVFDVANTVPGRIDSRELNQWMLKPEYIEPVSESLNKAYGIQKSNLPDMLRKLAENQSIEYYHSHEDELTGITRDHPFLKPSDMNNPDEIPFSLTSSNVQYILFTRCGMDADAESLRGNMDGIYLFDNPRSFLFFGDTVSNISERILRDIEGAIKRFEREQSRGTERIEPNGDERNYISPGGRHSVAGSDLGRTAGTEQIRADEIQLSQGTPAGGIPLDVAGGNAIPALPGDSADSGTPDGTHDEVFTGERPAAGQGIGSNGLGSTHEHAPGSGGRNIERTVVQLDLGQFQDEAEDLPSPVFSITGNRAGNNSGNAQPIVETESYAPPETQINGTESINQSPIETPPQPLINFRITDDHLGEGGAKTKFKNNITAIETLKQIENESRHATPAEQETLSKYVGWGGIAQAFDPNNEGWSKEYEQLLASLSPDEYAKARASVLNSHYTSPTVIKAIYDTVEHLGFTGGNILEPSCGIGNFFGLLPDSMASSKLYGVELDDISGRIARRLYPNANISIMGYEKTSMPDSFFDLSIGNIPFGGYRLAEKRYDKYNLQIHDHFIVKALDQTRPGGIVSFITSKGTLDKKSLDVRKYIAERADLLGAVRLPNDAFLRNAGTEVTTDILFLQKRDSLVATQPEWVHLNQTDKGIPINNYFIEHPEMLLGEMAFDSGMYGNQSETACNPIPGADLAEQLRSALSHIQGSFVEADLDNINAPVDNSIPADPNVRNYSYTIIDDKVYYRENSRMNPVELSQTAEARVKGLTGLRDCVHGLINCQLENAGDAEVKERQAELNRLYGAYTRTYGLINNPANARVYLNDSAYYLLCSLEVLDENRQLERKADIFSKRTIKQRTVPTSVDTSSEALAVSISERAGVDLNYMSQLTGKPKDMVAADLEGVIFRLPNSGGDEPVYVTADAYLSGNVREKLMEAREALKTSDQFAVNVRALEAAQPKDLTASEISVRLGATWVDQSFYERFLHELLESSYIQRLNAHVHYSPATSQWYVSDKNAFNIGILANVTYGTSQMNAAKIIEETLNLKDVRIYKTVRDHEGNERRVLDNKETTLARQKQETIKDAFKDWVFKDPKRRNLLVKRYNELFNSTRPREYDGKHLTFNGINPEITLRPHQLAAISHILYGGNTLLAHEVGAGKSFEMIAAAMESKRLGLCSKSLICVPNHLTEQMASEFLLLYPAANLLVATAKDFETANRRKFCGKIATGDYDSIIIGHSQMEKIPVSAVRQERLIREQIDEITQGIEEMKNARGERFTIKQMEKSKKSLEAKLAKLLDTSRKDSTITFEQLVLQRKKKC
jgi:N12 class adenine-specific DNA methylase